MPEPGTPATRDRSSFISTRWSLVQAAGGPCNRAAQEALEELCRLYWYPLYSYIRRRGHAHAEAEDLVQGFFVHLLERQLFAVADKSRGRLRGLLLSSLRYFLTDEYKRAGAVKRGGEITFIPLDTASAEERYAREPAGEAPPDAAFERSWARTLVDRAANHLRGAWVETGKTHIFDALRPFLLGRMDGAAARQVAQELGMTETHVKVSLHRLREQFGTALRREVAETVTSEADLEEELAALRAVIL